LTRLGDTEKGGKLEQHYTLRSEDEERYTPSGSIMDKVGKFLHVRQKSSI